MFKRLVRLRDVSLDVDVVNTIFPVLPGTLVFEEIHVDAIEFRWRSLVHLGKYPVMVSLQGVKCRVREMELDRRHQPVHPVTPSRQIGIEKEWKDVCGPPARYAEYQIADGMSVDVSHCLLHWKGSNRGEVVVWCVVAPGVPFLDSDLCFVACVIRAHPSSATCLWRLPHASSRAAWWY